ncbi:DUF1501 domain-containing protein [Actinospongicola halichondriae]|uniref:DUF1501 domain-containing protein n=1 Tax=Actinospongicola halichondriae TaxID=3236844 RepID=UPI003D45986E
MSSIDPTMSELRTALSLPAPTDALSLSRRHFLQAAAAGIGISMLPNWITESAGASTAIPTGTAGNRGTLVLVVLDGGNDGLHMVPPISNGSYHDARGALAFSEANSLPINGQRAFHPALTRLKARYDAGDVAIIDGVGNPRRDLSHFSAMADFQHGGPASQFSRTGWVGRYLDQTGAGPFGAIAIGDRVPLIAHGETRSAITLPWKIDRVPKRRSWAAPLDGAIEQWGEIPTGHGALADRVAGATAGMLGSADSLRPSYASSFSGSSFAGELQLCANLVNAGLGARVLTVRHGPYDSHTNQTEMHGNRMAELDEGIDLFFQTLGADVADDVTLVCISEFGRRVGANGGAGTDHGAGNAMIAVGRPIAGGFHGSLPSLTSLTADGNLTHEIDYRSVFATLIDGVLGASHTEILGGEFTPVPFLETTTTPPTTTTAPPTTTTTAPPTTTTTAPPTTTTVPPTTTTAPPTTTPPGPPSRWPFRPRRWSPRSTDSTVDAGERMVTAGEADMLRLYRALTDQEPDAAVARTLLKAHAKGMPAETIAERLGLSPALTPLDGSLSNERFVAATHQRLLGRELDLVGRRQLVRLLDQGEMNRFEAIRRISSTPEFRRRFQYTVVPR